MLQPQDSVVLVHCAEPFAARSPDAAADKQARELERCKRLLQGYGEYSGVAAAAIDTTQARLLMMGNRAR